MTISGAYGRDYKNRKAILTDWNANKDFIQRSINARGTYINKQDAENSDMVSLTVRYGKDTKVTVINRSSKGWK